MKERHESGCVIHPDMPDWEGIRAFTAVVRGKTARAAAKSLNVHHSTISRRVEQLEASLKTRLFDRHPDGYVLTSSGERLFEVATRFADDLNDVSREISGGLDELSGSLRVTMPGPLCAHAIVPQLPLFAAEYPDIEIKVIPTYGLLDIARREADVAIRMDSDPPNGLIGRRVCKYRQAAYASPEYLANHDLATRPEAARWLGWEDPSERFPEWAEGTGCEGVPAWGYFPNPQVQIAAAKSGLGIALLPCLLGDREPGLARASDAPPIDARDLWILTHRDLEDTPRVKAFMDFAEKALRSLEPEMLGVADANSSI
ncbi:MAG: LysR family transcriptional regulator [Myxococcota bacterium]